MEGIKTMNSLKILIMSISILLIISILTLLWFKVSFIDQPLKNIDKIVVVIEPYHGGEKAKRNIIDYQEIEYVYSLLKQTSIVYVNRYPNHLSSLQFDPKFSIQVEYKNGKTDRYSAASPDAIFRQLDIVTIHGDRGYIRGSNGELWKYVLNLQ